MRLKTSVSNLIKTFHLNWELNLRKDPFVAKEKEKKKKEKKSHLKYLVESYILKVMLFLPLIMYSICLRHH